MTQKTKKTPKRKKPAFMYDANGKEIKTKPVPCKNHSLELWIRKITKIEKRNSKGDVSFP